MKGTIVASSTIFFFKFQFGIRATIMADAALCGAMILALGLVWAEPHLTSNFATRVRRSSCHDHLLPCRPWLCFTLTNHHHDAVRFSDAVWLRSNLSIKLETFIRVSFRLLFVLANKLAHYFGFYINHSSCITDRYDAVAFGRLMSECRAPYTWLGHGSMAAFGHDIELNVCLSVLSSATSLLHRRFFHSIFR